MESTVSLHFNTFNTLLCLSLSLSLSLSIYIHICIWYKYFSNIFPERSDIILWKSSTSLLSIFLVTCLTKFKMR